MAGATTSTVEEILKETYPLAIQNQNNQEELVNTLFETADNVKAVGKYGIVPVKIGRNYGGGGSVLQGESLATDQSQKYEQLQVFYHSYKKRISFTPELEDAASGGGAFAQEPSDEIDGAVEDAIDELDAQLSLTGGTGVIAQCGVTSADTTVVLDADTFEAAMRYFDIDMPIDIGTIASGYTNVATDRLITAVDIDAKTIDISGAAVTTDATHFIVFANQGSVLGGANQRTVTGIDVLIDDTLALHGLDPATTPKWASHVEDVSGPLTEAAIRAASDKTRTLSGKAPNLLLSNVQALSAHMATLDENKRYGAMISETGFVEGYQVSAGASPMTWKVAYKLANNKVYGIRKSTLKKWVARDWDWLEQNGQMLWMNTDNATFSAILYRNAEYFVTNRNQNFKLTNISI